VHNLFRQRTSQTSNGTSLGSKCFRKRYFLGEAGTEANISMHIGRCWEVKNFSGLHYKNDVFGLVGTVFGMGGRVVGMAGTVFGMVGSWDSVRVCNGWNRVCNDWDSDCNGWDRDCNDWDVFGMIGTCLEWLGRDWNDWDVFEMIGTC
jgi:hypothetical protein